MVLYWTYGFGEAVSRFFPTAVTSTPVVGNDHGLFQKVDFLEQAEKMKKFLDST